MKKIKRIGRRALFYIITGYALASLPYVLFSYASSIYYLAIQNNNFLKMIFPSFTTFLIISAVSLPIACGIVGYLFVKVLWFFREQLDITTEANPYMNWKISPINIPIFKLYLKMAIQMGDKELADEYRELLKKNGVFLIKGGD